MTLAPNLFRSTDTGQHRPGHRVPVDRGDIGSGLNGGEITEMQALMVIGEAHRPPTLHHWVKHWWLVVLVVNLLL